MGEQGEGETVAKDQGEDDPDNHHFEQVKIIFSIGIDHY